MLLLRDLVALSARMGGAEMLDVAASPAGSADDPSAIAVQLRLSGDRVASITARRGESASLRLVASNTASDVMLRREGDTTTIQGASDAPDSLSETLHSDDSDLLLAEAKRVPEARATGGIDALLAAGEGVILSAIERALENGFAEHVDEHSRPALRLLHGGGRTPATASTSARRGALSVVPR